MRLALRRLRRLLILILACRAVLSVILQIEARGAALVFGPIIGRLKKSPLLAWLLRRVLGGKALSRLHGSQDALSDPVFTMRGAPMSDSSVAEMVRKCAPTELWEWWLDACNFRKESPVREHIRRVVTGDEFDQRVNNIFDVLLQRPPGSAAANGLSNGIKPRTALEVDDLIKFSMSITGNIRVMLRQKQSTPLAEPTEDELEWLRKNYHVLFPISQPLDRPLFIAWAKVIFVRRCAKTLIATISNASFGERVNVIRKGLRVNIVVNLKVSLSGRDEDCLLHIHTVAPRSAGKKKSLCLTIDEITEEEVDEDYSP